MEQRAGNAPPDRGKLGRRRDEAPTLAVSRSYLDRMVAHHLALGVEKGEVPSLGLLQVAETIGGADWQPARMALSEAIAGLIAEVPKPMCGPGALASVLRKSDRLAGLEAVAQSWFEDDPQVAEAVERASGRSVRSLPAISCRASLRDIVTNGLTSFCAPPFGCARRFRRPIYAGVNSRLLRKRSPTDGI